MPSAWRNGNNLIVHRILFFSRNAISAMHDRGKIENHFLIRSSLGCPGTRDGKSWMLFHPRGSLGQQMEKGSKRRVLEKIARRKGGVRRLSSGRLPMNPPVIPECPRQGRCHEARWLGTSRRAVFASEPVGFHQDRALVTKRSGSRVMPSTNFPTAFASGGEHTPETMGYYHFSPFHKKRPLVATS